MERIDNVVTPKDFQHVFTPSKWSELIAQLNAHYEAGLLTYEEYVKEFGAILADEPRVHTT